MYLTSEDRMSLRLGINPAYLLTSTECWKNSVIHLGSHLIRRYSVYNGAIEL
jgi:hypothetical protein